MKKNDVGIRLYIHNLTRPLQWYEKWNTTVLTQIGIYFGICFILLHLFPNSLWDPELRHITYVIGILGAWRYCWWSTHAIRSSLYHRFIYPKLRSTADRDWYDGKRPRHLHFMMTTYKETKAITDMVIDSIIAQAREIGVPTTLWLGSGNSYDEDIISRRLSRVAKDLDFTVTIVRQNQSGKRMAMGLVLRAMNRAGIHKDDAVVFMDGDAVLGPGSVRKCVSLIQADPELQAVTTDEDVVCYGPNWVRRWLVLRFAQRRIAMGSHALSKKVLTLTGRMSVFRAKHITNANLIRLLEADFLDHWLWGRFRFLSGDDKSTWYYMLLQDAKMLYVPDACVYTIEQIEGNGLKRMKENFRRWCGNTLRNGSRAISLGPRKVGFFIWWCLLDQRIAMWTMLVSPILAIFATTLYSANYVLSYIVFIMISRMLLSLVLYTFNREVDISFPFILYVNQLFNAAVKIYCLFHLARQRWTNRGGQRSIERHGWVETYCNFLAKYIMILYLAMLFLGLLIYTRLIEIPTIANITTFGPI